MVKLTDSTQSSLVFKGQGDYINLGKKPEFRIEREITIEAWIYCQKQRRRTGIISNIFDTAKTQSGYGLLLDGKSGVFLGLKTVSKKIQYLSSKIDSLTLNKWHHIAGTYDGKRMKVYIDGVEKASKNIGESPLDYDPENDLVIGAYKDNNETHPFYGKITEVRLWNVARTQAEILNFCTARLVGNEPGIVGYWALNQGLNNTVFDQTPSGNSEIIPGAVWQQESLAIAQPSTYHQEEFTMSKSSQPVLAFDGIDDKIDIPYAPELNPTSFTAEVWVLFKGGENYRSVLTSRDANATEGCMGYLFYANPSQQWQFWIGSGEAGQSWIALDGPTVQPNVWTHLAGSYDADTQTLVFSVNGEEVSRKAGVKFQPNHQRPLRIGAGDTEQPVAQYFFNGYIAEVRLWNQARSLEEIKAKMSKRLEGTETGLAGYWMLAEGSGLIASDKGPNGKQGLIEENAVWEQAELPLPSVKISEADTVAQPNVTVAQSIQTVLNFDGRNDSVAVPTNTPRLQGNFTLEAWICPSTSSGVRVIYAEGENIFYLEGNELKFQKHSPFETISSTNKAIKLNVWTHVAVVKSGHGEGETQLYINGVQNDDRTAIPELTGFGEGRIGVQPGVAKRHFQGLISEVRIWNYARLSQEIQGDIYRRLVGKESGLLNYWSLTEGKGKTIHDNSPNAQNGVIQGGAAWKQSVMPLPKKEDAKSRLLRSTGLEDYGYWWQELYKKHDKAQDPPFRRGRIWA